MRAVRLASLAWGLLVACNTEPGPTSTSSPARTSIAASAAPVTASSAQPTVTLTSTEVRVGSSVIANVPPGALGFEAALKRSQNRSALEVVPLKEALQPVHQAATPGQPLRVVVDPHAAYRTFLEVFFSAARAGFTTFDLFTVGHELAPAVRASTPASQAEANALRTGSTPSVSVVLDDDGVTLTVAGVNIGPGCTKGTAGPAFRVNADLADVGRCVAELGALDPAWSSIHIAEVSAASGLEMEHVLAVVRVLAPTITAVHFGLLS